MATDYAAVAATMKALAHPVRLHILELLGGGERCVCHIEAALGKRQAYISQQLMVLRESGLVESRRDGLRMFYRLRDESVERLLAEVLGAIDVPAAIEGCPCPDCQPADHSLATPAPLTHKETDYA
jgi:ArsR family transcriptional regulator